MSTDLATRSSDLATWADEARAVHAIATSLAGTSFAPKTMQGRPDELTGAILAGRELGMSPMAALRSIDIIDGVPAVRAVALRGLVLAHGHDVWVEESTETRATVCGKRAGKTHVQRSVWTMDRARKANLAGKRNWQTHPAAMLVARATAEVCRLVAADVLIALPYVAEELGDVAPDETPPEQPARSPRRTVQRKPLPAPPELEQPPPEAAQADPAERPPVAAYGRGVPAERGPSVDDYHDAPPPITDRSRAALMAAYRDAGLGDDRAARLAHASAQVGRDLTSVNDLTEVEAQQVRAAVYAQLVEPGQR